MRHRIEKDGLGEFRVPADALYGAQTARARQNFPVSGIPFPRRFIWALGLIKRSAALANESLGALDTARAEWIAAAAQEVMDGRWDSQFPLDIFQTGSGTSTHMNANEVIANRAIDLMGGRIGSKDPVHPNDHVNLGQSSNDVIPTALHLAAAVSLREELLPALSRLEAALADRAAAFAGVIKTGRTHGMDATPVGLGQVFGGYAAQLRDAIARTEAALAGLLPLALGGTAVGTGINCPPGLPAAAIERINEVSGLEFRETSNHFAAQAAQDAVVAASGALRANAVALIKIANDIRLLGSGPRAGLGELRLPAVQPGSSIMPGKVNPVHCEMLILVGYQVMGNDAAIGLAGQGGLFELNATLPVLAHNLLQSIEIMANAAQIFADRCVAGLEADAEACALGLSRNLSLATALVPALGYDRAAAIAKEAYASNRTVRAVALAQGALPEAELDRLLDPTQMI